MILVAPLGIHIRGKPANVQHSITRRRTCCGYYHIFQCGTCVCVVIGLDDVKDVIDPQSTVTAGLVSASDTTVPLTSVHVRAQLVDLAAQVSVRVTLSSFSVCNHIMLFTRIQYI